MAFDITSSRPIKEDQNGNVAPARGFDVASSRPLSTPFHEGFSVKETLAIPFVKGARDVAVSSPQNFANLLVEYGEMAGKSPGFFKNAMSMAIPFHSIYKEVQALKDRQNPAEGRAYVKAGRDIKSINKKWIAEKVKDFGDKDEGLAGFMYDLGGGATTLGAAIGVSVLTKSPAAATALFGIYQKGGIYGQARDKGVNPERASNLSTAAGAVEGALEYIGLDFMINKAGKYSAKLFLRMGSEALQEWSQTVGENLIVKFGGIDKARGVWEGAGRSALVGAILGGGANVVLSTLEKSGTMETLEEAGVDRGQVEEKINEIYTEVEKEAYRLTQEEIVPPVGDKGAKTSDLASSVKPIDTVLPDISGETKIRGLAKGVEEKAIENKLTESLGDLPEYKTMNMKEQAKKAETLLNEDYEKARNIAMGKELPPADILPESVFVAVENKAVKEGDVDTIRDLALSSGLVEEATAMGQRLRTLGERDPESPITAIKEVSKIRQERAKKRLKGKNMKKAVKQDVADLKSEMKKVVAKKDVWMDFIKSIEC